MAYPHKWSPISYKSSAVLYRWTTPPREGERGEGRDGKKERREGEVERLHAKFHLNVFIVSASGGQKPQFSAKF